MWKFNPTKFKPSPTVTLSPRPEGLRVQGGEPVAPGFEGGQGLCMRLQTGGHQLGPLYPAAVQPLT